MADELDFLQSMGQKVRKLREKKGLTIAEVARFLDKSASQVGSIERADRCPSMLILKQLADFYEVPLAYLFEDDLIQFQQQIGNYIQAVLVRQGISVAELAHKAGINYFELAEFFQGRGSLLIEQIKQIARVLNLPAKKIVPETVRYVNLIEHYLNALGLDEDAIKNVVEYIYSRYDI